MPHDCPTVPRLQSPAFLVLAWDADNSAALRERDLEAHLAHVETHWRSYIVAGPLRDSQGETVIGSMLVVMAENETAASNLLKADPYFSNGQYRQVDITRVTPAVGLFLGGKIWSSADDLRPTASRH